MIKILYNFIEEKIDDSINEIYMIIFFALWILFFTILLERINFSFLPNTFTVQPLEIFNIFLIHFELKDLIEFIFKTVIGYGGLSIGIFAIFKKVPNNCNKKISF